MKVINLGESPSVLNSYLAEMRDRTIQKDSMRFRRNLERVGEFFGIEISRTLDYSEKEVTTPLGIARVSTFDTPLVLATILRAGLPLQQGLLNVFDTAETACLATYCTAPLLDGKTLILSDSMLATGSSIEITLQKLIEEGGAPTHTHLVCPVASRYAVDYLSSRHGDDMTLWVAAIDEELTSRSYIIPGIGDAGDLAFGGKA